MTLPVGVLVSGRGTNLQAILDGQKKLKDETQQEQQRRFFDLIK